MLAFIALLAGLALLARQLHQLRRPAIVRGAHPAPRSQRSPFHPD
jgi:hypothetical protein